MMRDLKDLSRKWDSKTSNKKGFLNFLTLDRALIRQPIRVLVVSINLIIHESIHH